MRSVRHRGMHRAVGIMAACGLLLAACGTDGQTATPTDESDQPADAPEQGDGDGDATGEGLLAGETITFVVGVSPGGGYDSYARMIAPFLAEELGANVVVENQPGAGGLVSLNNLYAAEPDGTTIALANGSGTGGNVLTGAEGMEFEYGEFSALGRVAGEPKVLVAAADSGYESMEDLLADPEGFRYGTTGPGGSTHTDALLLRASLGIPGELVSGFDGSEEIGLALAAGELQGTIGTLDSHVPDIEAGDQVPIAMIANERAEDFPDVPTVLEYVEDEDQRVIAETHTAVIDLGRALLAPPGLPDDILNELRQAIENVFTSEEFLAEAESQNRPIGFLTGEELAERIQVVVNAPESVFQALQEQ
ncbi:Bug family tripartite tricarboxylate transporter substrate binding protein [Egicoccus sp. AB-alg6-2]|uniref:Bug family tripartite tricarboxylate transporter substrate binding protein n=1 Tax=Egicoccus sp. AB-alg6-2 TaxID=3242692 RepID=UPI00359E8D56